MKEKLFIIPEYTTATEIKQIRKENAAVSSSSLYQKKIWQRRWGKSHVS